LDNFAETVGGVEVKTNANLHSILRSCKPSGKAESVAKSYLDRLTLVGLDRCGLKVDPAKPLRLTPGQSLPPIFRTDSP
jgi:hypothetical protein